MERLSDVLNQKYVKDLLLVVVLFGLLLAFGISIHVQVGANGIQAGIDRNVK